MKILKTLTLLALAFCATLVYADPPSQVGRLNYISGPVSFAPAEANDDWAVATLNRPITTGDRLWADNGGRAEMHVGSTAIRLAELTSVDVLNVDDRNIQLRLAQGSLNVRLRRLPSGNVFEVDTPHGAVILRQPGSYRISVDWSAAETTVDVRSGQADVLTGASSFPVQANQQAKVTGTSAPSYNIAAARPADEFDRWAAARDQKEDRIAATRYVPAEMTGYEDLDDHGSWRIVEDYGSVWVPAVPVGWAPYRYGHWVWISPWGWTWVDSAPWGFAPFHYGRWVWIGSYWAWAPGPVVARPVYAPALVVFVGGSNWSVSVGIGAAPVVGWVPLGWREPYIPWYRVSPAYVRNVNVAHVNNINLTNIYNITSNNTTVTNIKYANRSVPSGVTVVRREAFVSAKPVENTSVNVSSQTLAVAPVTAAAPVRAPGNASLAVSRPGPKPPAAVAAREVVAVSTPPRPVRNAEGIRNRRGSAFAASSEEQPRVRVIDPRRVNAPTAQSAGEAEPQQQQAERQNRRERSAENHRPQAQSNPPQAQSNPQLERRGPAPPPEVSRRPTFDRDMRASTPPPSALPATSGPRPPQQAEQATGRDRSASNALPRAQPKPQQERGVPVPSPAISERSAPPAAPIAARDRGGNGNNGRAVRQESRPTPHAEPGREKAREQPREGGGPHRKADRD